MGSIHYSAIPEMGIADVIALVSPEVVTLLSLPVTPEIIVWAVGLLMGLD